MEKRFLDKVEDNMTIQIWSKKTQQEKGDSLTEGYMSELWDFTRISADLVPTVEEYITLLCCPRIQADKAYSGAANILTFLKRLISITGMNEQWFAKNDLGTSRYKEKSRRLRHEYLGLVIFPKAPGHIDDTVLDIFDQLDKRVTPVPKILVETFRSLSTCQRAVFSESYSPVERIRGYPKARQHLGGKVDGNSPESLRRKP
ncbi:hypothetical protein Goari_010361 [Gossypium aridum]|uniref:Uncharacterized protein n=1 Tax=Gossypium aridum TaxID=34290 RepID=A0A7J8Y1E6_GOSAI|nr:hypothetical protein [Gossypium aridum]